MKNYLYLLFFCFVFVASCADTDNENFSCVSGNCQVDENGSYSNLSDCQTNCNINYSCVNENCQIDENGNYSSLSECESNCSNSLVKYACENGYCDTTQFGTYNSISDCEYYCTPELYTCNNGNCVLDENGEFTSIANCQNQCSTLPYACIDGNCQTNANGNFSNLFECQNNCSNLNCPSTVTDIDGNTYSVTQIANKCWMTENLKTTRYNDGSAITTGLTAGQWYTANYPAYAIYDNDPANDLLYGKLYNFYAVATGKLCPTGWHIPTHAEWTDMIDYYSFSVGFLNDATMFKSSNLWTTGGTNISGFSGLPSGFRSTANGNFLGEGFVTYFWTSSPVGLGAYYRVLDEYDSEIGSFNNKKSSGYSCRCIKD